MLNESTLPSPHATPHLTALEPLFGGFVPHDGVVQTQRMHRLLQTDRELQLWRVSVGEPAWISWTLTLVWPHHAKRCPVLLSPDACWPHVLGHDAVSAALQQDTALAWFNRTELAFDNDTAQREGPVFEQSYQYLENAGMEEVRQFKRSDAKAVLDYYKNSGGRIYNGRD